MYNIDQRKKAAEARPFRGILIHGDCTAWISVPFFSCSFQRFQKAAAWPVLHFCGLEHFCKMHEVVYRPMHEGVYGRFRRLFPMHEVVYRPMHAAVYAFRSEIHCTWSFTPIYKNQCTWSFTTFFEILRPVAIGSKEGKRAFYVTEKALGAAFYPVKSCLVAACIAPACLLWVILYPLRKDA